jgi:hypothetical protein
MYRNSMPDRISALKSYIFGVQKVFSFDRLYEKVQVNTVSAALCIKLCRYCLGAEGAEKGLDKYTARPVLGGSAKKE